MSNLEFFDEWTLDCHVFSDAKSVAALGKATFSQRCATVAVFPADAVGPSAASGVNRMTGPLR
ncbi:hypothetical protein DIPPA_23831 [Diplonema papillatum]|nr:hypothetical protein DIPPA_23831 [Diplonema papillatum]